MRQHRALYAVIVVVLALTMTTFALETAYKGWMVGVVTSGVKDTITGDALIMAPGSNPRSAFGESQAIPDARGLAQNISARFPGYQTGVRVILEGSYNVGGGYDGAVVTGLNVTSDPQVPVLERSIVAGRWFQPGPHVRGHRPVQVQSTNPLTGQLAVGSERPGETPYPIVVGDTAASIYHLHPGQTFNMSFTTGGAGISYVSVSVRIVGIYRSPVPTLSELFWFMPADSVREIKGYGHTTGPAGPSGWASFQTNPNMGDAVLVRAPRTTDPLLDIQHSESVKTALEAAAPRESVLTWHDFVNFVSGHVLDTLSLLLWGSIALTLLLAGAAVKYVFDSILLRKTREIGALKAFGASDGMVLRIFLYQGVLLGLAAGVLALGLSVLVMAAIRWYGLQVAFLGGSDLALTLTLSPLSVAISLGVPLVLGVLAVLPPALRAARLPPVEAVRQGQLAF